MFTCPRPMTTATYNNMKDSPEAPNRIFSIISEHIKSHAANSGYNLYKKEDVSPGSDIYGFNITWFPLRNSFSSLMCISRDNRSFLITKNPVAIPGKRGSVRLGIPLARA